MHIVYSKYRAFKYDLRIDNLIIEFNGDYYHCNPMLSPYSNPDYFNKVKKKTSKEIWEQDNIKNSLAESKGFFVHVVWESDWKTNKESCLQKIKEIHERINFSNSLVHL